MAADLIHLRTLLDDIAPVNWVLTGDSITHGLVHTQGERNYVDHLHELIRGDLGRARDALINTAISGRRIVQLLDDFERIVESWHPQVVTLMIGTNDCSTAGVFPVIDAAEFATSVMDFVRRVREIGAIPVLMTPPTIDVANAPERARIAEFASAVRTVAESGGVILIDQFARFTELGAGRPGAVPWSLLADPFHPNATGHAVLALEIADRLGLDMPGSRVIARLRAMAVAS